MITIEQFNIKRSPKIILAFFFILIILVTDSKQAFSKIKYVPKKSVLNIITIAEEELKSVLDSKGVLPSEFMKMLMDKRCSTVDIQKNYREILSLLSENKDSGIRFESGYSFNSSDLGDNTHDIYAGLAWNVFQEGYYKYSSDAKKYRYMRSIADLDRNQLANRELLKCRNLFIVKYFNFLKNSIQVKRKKVLNDYYHLMRTAYFLGDIYADELLKAELEINRTKRILKNYKNKEIKLKSKNSKLNFNLLISPDIKNIIQSVDKDPYYKKTQNLNVNILKEKYGAWRDKSLKFYIRTGVSEKDGEIDSGDIRAGIYFKTPIFSKKNDLLPFEISGVKQRIEKDKENKINEIIRIGNNCNRRVVEAIKKYYSIRIVGERLRRALIDFEKEKNQTGYYGFKSYIKLKRILQELMDVKFEFLEIQENIYGRILNLLTVSGVSWERKYIKDVKPEIKLKRGRTGDRSLYIWSEGFKKYNNNFLIRVFEAKGISNIILSASKKIDYNKLSRFIKTAGDNSVSVELMISENSWIKAENWEKVKKKIVFLKQFSKTIHFDIEPHTFDDYRKKRKFYDTAFLELMRKVRGEFKDEVKITVSLPTLHKKEFIQNMSKFCDGIYIMAYGIKNTKRMKRKLKNFEGLKNTKIVVALRPKDFSSELKIEMFIDRIAQNSKISKFAFHDLRQFFNLVGNN